MSKADTLEKVCSTEKLESEQREGKEMTKAFWLHRIFRRRGQETKKAEQPNKVRAASVDGEPPEVGWVTIELQLNYNKLQLNYNLITIEF